MKVNESTEWWKRELKNIDKCTYTSKYDNKRIMHINPSKRIETLETLNCLMLRLEI